MGRPWSSISCNSSTSTFHTPRGLLAGGLPQARSRLKTARLLRTLSLCERITLNIMLYKLQHRNPPPAPHPPNPYPGLPHGTTPSEHRLYGTEGPLWYRGWALDSEAVACSRVDAVLEKTGTRRMIMGHTPDFEACSVYSDFPAGADCVQKIVSRCGGKIIIIDTG